MLELDPKKQDPLNLKNSWTHGLTEIEEVSTVAAQHFTWWDRGYPPEVDRSRHITNHKPEGVSNW